MKELKPQVHWHQLEDQLNDQLHLQLWNQLRNQLNPQLYIQLENQLNLPLWKELK